MFIEFVLCRPAVVGVYQVQTTSCSTALVEENNRPEGKDSRTVCEFMVLVGYSTFHIISARKKGSGEIWWS
jgi:hypothetical protein